jgi:hypothetical protein
MTVTSPVSFTKIRTEFSPRGTSNNFSDYYKGGTYVKNTDIDPAPFVSSTVIGLAMSQFLDSQYVVPLSVTLPDYNPSSQNIMLSITDTIPLPNSGSASVFINLNSDGSGSYQTYDLLGVVVDYGFTWLTAGSSSNAYAYMDGPSGSAFDLISSPINTSLQLNTSRSWSISVQGVGPTSASLTSTLRIKNSSGTDLVAKTLSMTAALA